MPSGENLTRVVRPPPLRARTPWQQDRPQKAWPHKGHVLMTGKTCCHNLMLPSKGELTVGQVSISCSSEGPTKRPNCVCPHLSWVLTDSDCINCSLVSGAHRAAEGGEGACDFAYALYRQRNSNRVDVF